MGQTQAKRPPHPVGIPPSRHTAIGKPKDPLRGIQREVQRGAREATGAERFFGAPLRNQAEIQRIVERWRGDIVKEVNFSIERMEDSSSQPQVIQNGIKRSYLSAMKMRAFFDRSRSQDGQMGITDALYRQIMTMIPFERKLNRTNIERINGVPTQKNTDEFQEYDTKMTILMLQAKQQLAQLLMTQTSAARQLKDELAEEERKYQERLAGFRSGWVFGTAFVAVKQGIERILNSPALRKAYLEVFAVPVSLIPVVGPLIAQIMRSAATDPQFDIGDFLRELFSHGVGTVLKLMAEAAAGLALPAGVSQGLRKVVTMGSGLVARTVGVKGATTIVRNVNKHSQKLNNTAKESVRKVA